LGWLAISQQPGSVAAAVYDWPPPIVPSGGGDPHAAHAPHGVGRRASQREFDRLFPELAVTSGEFTLKFGEITALGKQHGNRALVPLVADEFAEQMILTQRQRHR
jgi:hypothetical protein